MMLTPDEIRRAAASLRTVGGAYEYVAACVEYDNAPPTVEGCGHADAYRTPYTGTLCAACYREAEMRIPGLASYCAQLRTLAAPTSVAAGRLEERVQETREQRLLIDPYLLDLADTLFATACAVVISTAPRLHIDPPYYLNGREHVGRYTETNVSVFAAASVEAWLDRNLWLIVALPDAANLLDPLVDALTRARRAVDPSPPRRPAIRGACRDCLTGRVNIEVRERGIFHSTCGGCGRSGPIHAKTVEAVLRGDSDRGGEGDRPHTNDAMALPGNRSATEHDAGT